VAVRAGPFHPNKGNGLQISNDTVVLNRVICFRHNDRLYASSPFRRLLNRPSTVASPPGFFRRTRRSVPLCSVPRSKARRFALLAHRSRAGWPSAFSTACHKSAAGSTLRRPRASGISLRLHQASWTD
jgi:hypothetical protein